MAYTVKQMARVLTRSTETETIERVVRQIRYWTQNSWIEPHQLHTGTGISRTYDADNVYQAAVLMEVSRFGLTPFSTVALCEYMEDFDEGPWRSAIAGKYDVYLVGLFSRYGEVTWKTDGTMATLELLSSKHKNDENSHPGSPHRYRSAITINITKLFADLDFEKANG